MRGTKMKGFMDPITIGVIVACFLVGGFFMIKSEKVDHPVEQVVESVLDMHGIDVDFSEGKKKDEDVQ